MDSLLFAVSLWMVFIISWAQESTLTTAANPKMWPQTTVTFRNSSEEEKKEPDPEQLVAKNHKLDYSRNKTDHGNIRRSEDHIEWGWDKWCQLQPRVGDCRERHRSFFYQAQTDSCREFTYTGCEGNQNRFANKYDCEQFCKGFGHVLPLKSLSLQEACTLQPDSGNCLAYFIRFYFDINQGRCRQFAFGGCGGNPNRFDTEEACRARCGQLNKRSSKVRS